RLVIGADRGDQARQFRDVALSRRPYLHLVVGGHRAASQWPRVVAVEVDLKDSALAAHRLERRFARRFEFALQPRHQLARNAIGGRGFSAGAEQFNSDGALKRKLLYPIGALKSERDR